MSHLFKVHAMERRAFIDMMISSVDKSYPKDYKNIES